MTRILRNWKEEPSSSTPTAPHRYSWDDDSEPPENTYAAVKAAAPYKTGDVVLTVYGDGYRRARVYAVFVRRTYHDDYREVYRVQKETKVGHWSKMFTDVHPGQVQRAYARAGLAPEMPEKEWR